MKMPPSRMLQAPFWSRIPLFGLTAYPASAGARIVFWLSTLVYSLLYFYLLAFGVVVFTHALWVWSGWHNYLATTLYDVVYRNAALVAGFIVLESFVIYRQARSTSLAPRERGQAFSYRTLSTPFVVLVVLYGSLKLLTGHYVLEPHFVPVMIVAYAVLVAVKYTVDKFPPAA